MKVDITLAESHLINLVTHLELLLYYFVALESQDALHALSLHAALQYDTQFSVAHGLHRINDYAESTNKDITYFARQVHSYSYCRILTPIDSLNEEHVGSLIKTILPRGE